MRKLALTHTAFDRLYGSVRLVVMSVGIHKTLSRMIPAALDVLILDKTGELRVPGEVVESGSKIVRPIGGPTGLLGFIVDRPMAENAIIWSDWISNQTGRQSPPVVVVKKNKVAAMQCLTEMAMQNADEVRKSAASVQTDLAVLRRDFERSLINLEKARRLIRGVGYDTRYSTVSVPVGKETVAPRGLASPLKPFVARFPLPVDAAGVQGISLHFVVPKGARSEGSLTVLLLRSVDSHVLGTAELLFSEIDAGWTYLVLERGMLRSFGDAELVLEWSVVTEGAVPEISLTDAALNRCGAPSDDGEEVMGRSRGTLPALKIWSGFDPGELTEGHSFLSSPMEHRRTSIRKLMNIGAAITGSETIDSVLSHDPSGGWVQTHLQKSGPVGLVFQKLVPAAAQALTITCETAHSSGPTCLYLVAVGGTAATDQEYLAQLLENAKSGEDINAYDAETGVSWSVQTVPAGVQHQLTVDMTCLQDNLPAQNLGMAVVSATGETGYGWCRWHDISVALDTVRGHSVTSQLLSENNQPVLRMRSVKFPEIGDQIEFLAGRARLQDLNTQLGFSPMIVPDDHGSLQTHPITEGVSAALYRSGAAAGTTLVACDVETAHERAPDFLYVLALVKAGTPDKYDIFQSFVGELADRDFLATRGYDEKRQMYYSARRLPALQVEAVSIDLDTPLDEDHDIIVAALPVQDIISYGWCRWLSLSIASVVDLRPQFNLKSPDQ